MRARLLPMSEAEPSIAPDVRELNSANRALKVSEFHDFIHPRLLPDGVTLKLL